MTFQETHERNERAGYRCIFKKKQEIKMYEDLDIGMLFGMLVEKQ